jgi:hypothetical protein
MGIKNKEHSPFFKKPGSSGISSPKITRTREDSPRSGLTDSDGDKV